MDETLDQLVDAKRRTLGLHQDRASSQKKRVDVVLTQEQQQLLVLFVEGAGATFEYAGKKYGLAQARRDGSWYVAVDVGEQDGARMWETVSSGLDSTNIWDRVLDVLARE